MSQPKPPNAELAKLSETGLTLADSTEDIGHVSALFIDQSKRKVQVLEIRAGGFLEIGDRHFLLPVEAITNVAEGEIHINQTLERVVNSPAYDPALAVPRTPEYLRSDYGYYGMSPAMGAGFLYPNF